MAEFPALPLFTDAFISDTTHLNATQTGAYLLLLMHAWRARDCALPADDRVLARMARMDGRAWASHKAVVLAFWDKVNIDGVDKYVQRRLLDEYSFVALRSRKNAEAGKASALKRLNRASTNVQRNVNQNSTPTPTPIPDNKISSYPTAAREPVPVDNIEELPDCPGSYSVVGRITSQGWDRAAEHAPGWDLNRLAEKFSSGVNSGAIKAPKFTDAAFAAWCLKVTGGKPPP